jgi:hypothetical protein
MSRLLKMYALQTERKKDRKKETERKKQKERNRKLKTARKRIHCGNFLSS